MEDEDEVLHNDPLVAMERAMDAYAAVCQRQEIEFDKFERAKFAVGLDCFIKTAEDCSVALESVKVSLGYKTKPKEKRRPLPTYDKLPVEERMRHLHDLLNNCQKWTRTNLAVAAHCNPMLVTMAISCLPKVKSKRETVDSKTQIVLWRTKPCEFAYNPKAHYQAGKKSPERKLGSLQEMVLEFAQKGPVTADMLADHIPGGRSKAVRVLLSLRRKHLKCICNKPETYVLATS